MLYWREIFFVRAEPKCSGRLARYGALHAARASPPAPPPPSCACHTGRYRRASAQPAAARNSGALGRPVGLSKAVEARPPVIRQGSANPWFS